MFVPFCLRKTGLISAVSEFFSVWRVGGRGSGSRGDQTRDRESRDERPYRHKRHLRSQTSERHHAPSPSPDPRPP